MDRENKEASFSSHLEELRKTLFRILSVTAIATVIIFCFKDITFRILLGPSHCDFITFRLIETLVSSVEGDFHFAPYDVQLIAVDLSSQFMAHITMSVYLALLVASPYILYQLFRFVSPALYQNERKYSKQIVTATYLLFMIGVMVSYFLLFPFAFRFLGTYQVAETVKSTITLDSYISTFISLTLVMGLVFQLPIITFFLGKIGIIDAAMLRRYRRHALVLIMIISAIITPPDVMTMVLVTLPMYLLYEASILIVKKTKK